MSADLSAPARRALAKLAGSHGVVPVAGQLGPELVRAGYATRIGRGYAITASGISAAAVQAPTDSAEKSSRGRDVVDEPTEPLF